MDKETIQEQVKLIEGKRGFLVELLEKPDLGILRVDVKQALEELDELLEDFELTFPDNSQLQKKIIFVIFPMREAANYYILASPNTLLISLSLRL